jgi:hypothetical protein
MMQYNYEAHLLTMTLKLCDCLLLYRVYMHPVSTSRLTSHNKHKPAYTHLKSNET